MVILNLFPGGVLQLRDILENGYGHAGSQEFLDGKMTNLIVWARLPADAVFTVLGVVPLFIVVTKAYIHVRRSRRS